LSSTNTRTRILDAAIGLIKKRRGANISMAEVATAAGISRQGLYLHFADRAELLVQLARHADEKRGLHEALAEVMQAPTGYQAMRGYVQLQARMNPGIWTLARAVDGARRDDPDVERAWQDRLAARLKICREIVRLLAEDPGLKSNLNEAAATDLMWSVTSLRMWEDLVLCRNWTARQYEAYITSLLEDALLDAVPGAKP
jgi:AcrR family transcriptional regulator